MEIDANPTLRTQVAKMRVTSDRFERGCGGHGQQGINGLTACARES
jgi:hypothetical protein